MTVAALFHRPPAGPAADRDLLRRFAADRDDAAFAELVRRYGRLVFATCLRVLNHRADAEDAYQASFLVLARRAAAVRSDERLAGWLHTVAVRTATEVRRMRDRRRTAEAAPSLTLPAPTDAHESRELAAALDQELAKLPDHYRLPVVLCELNGVSRKGAARELGIAEGTLSSRLAKARKLLAERLAGRGYASVSAGALTAALASSAVARVPALLETFTDCGASAAVLSVTDTVVKAMFATKLKAGALVAVLLALTGGAVWTTAAGAGPGADGPVKEAVSKPDPAPLVAQLGSKDFAERESAEKRLKELGAAAYAAVLAGTKSEVPEVAQRCRKLLPHVRAAWLARPESEQWKRFAAITGDTKLARELFVEMASHPDRAARLEVDPPADQYAALVTKALADLKAGYEEADRAAGGRTGVITPTRGEPTRSDATLLFFLGSAEGGAKPVIPERSFWLFSNYVARGLSGLDTRAKPDEMPTFPPEVARLFAAWLDRHLGDEYHRKVGLDLARSFAIPAALPAARAVLANDRLTRAERTPALYVIGAVGEKADLDRVRPFLECETVFHATTYHDDNRKQFPLTTQVRDVAHAVAGWLLGGDPAALEFEFCAKYDKHGADAFKEDYLLGFTSDEKRKAAHAKVQAVLANAPVPKAVGPAKPRKLPRAPALPDELVKEFAGPSVLCTAEMVGKITARVTELEKRFPSAEDRARVALHAAKSVANGRLSEDAATVATLADKVLELSRDPDTCWRARSLLASIVYVSGKPAAEKKQRQAEILLAGYAELLAQDLPDVEPEWPAAPERGGFILPPKELAEHQAAQAAYQELREQVDFTKSLVFGRKVLVMQLRDLYKPAGADELRALAAKSLTAGEVKTLLARVFDEK